MTTSERRLETYKRYQKSDAGKRAKQRLNLRRKYGISLEDYEALVYEQDGVCAICKQPPTGHYRRLCVDHDHFTDEIRALLCSKCNTALGMAEDSPERLRAMAIYLEEHKA